MCNNENTATALAPYSLKSLTDPTCTAAAAAYLEHYRLQLYNYASYADRFRYTHPALASHFALAASPYGPPGHPQSHHLPPPHHHHHADGNPFAAALGPYAKFDPRAYRVQEEPKPQHSYIGLIGMAILSSPDKKLVLSDIYQYILDNYAYFRSRGPGWRNSIRHNLSLNDCFIKAGRSANGKGHYWAIHPANLEDFKKGDFRRRKAQRRVRKHMGLSVPEDEDSSSPPPPSSSSPPMGHESALNSNASLGIAKDPSSVLLNHQGTPQTVSANTSLQISSRRRQFDMESLLAPDHPRELQLGASGINFRNCLALQTATSQNHVFRLSINSKTAGLKTANRHHLIPMLQHHHQQDQSVDDLLNKGKKSNRAKSADPERNDGDGGGGLLSPKDILSEHDDLEEVSCGGKGPSWICEDELDSCCSDDGECSSIRSDHSRHFRCRTDSKSPAPQSQQVGDETKSPTVVSRSPNPSERSLPSLGRCASPAMSEHRRLTSTNAGLTPSVCGLDAIQTLESSTYSSAVTAASKPSPAQMGPCANASCSVVGHPATGRPNLCNASLQTWQKSFSLGVSVRPPLALTGSSASHPSSGAQQQSYHSSSEAAIAGLLVEAAVGTGAVVAPTSNSAAAAASLQGLTASEIQIQTSMNAMTSNPSNINSLNSNHALCSERHQQFERDPRRMTMNII